MAMHCLLNVCVGQCVFTVIMFTSTQCVCVCLCVGVQESSRVSFSGYISDYLSVCACF